MRNNINYIISEEINKFINNLLTEDDSSKSIKAAKKLCVANGMGASEADSFIRNTMREFIPNLHGLGDKFILGCTRLYWEGAINDDKSKGLLTQIIGYICDNEEYYNKFDRNLNAQPLNGLANMFQPLIKGKLENDRASLEGKEFKNSDYDIIPINSFEEAAKYTQYFHTDNTWCITQKLGLYNSYSSKGINQIYFCLKRGFNDIARPKKSVDYKDDYGLSMISVIVNPDGSLAYATTRWNHLNGASGEHDLTTQEISEIVGANFYDTFKPNTVFQDKLSDCLNKIKHGYSPKEVFDRAEDFNEDLAVIKLGDKWNWVTKNGKILSPSQWFDLADSFSEGWAAVELNSKWNLINKKGDYLFSNYWFDLIRNFSEGWAVVVMNNKYNWINKNGDYLFPDQWFDSTHSFSKGWAVVVINDKYNWINKNGDYLFPDQWFNHVNDFEGDLADIIFKGKYNWTNTNGELLFSNQWFDHAGPFNSNGWARIKLKDKFNWTNQQGELLVPNQWFDMTGNFYKGWALIGLNGKWNQINVNGQLRGEWKDSAKLFPH